MNPSRQEIIDLVNRYLEGKISKEDLDPFLNGLDDPKMLEAYNAALKGNFEKSLRKNKNFVITSKKEPFIRRIGDYWMQIAATLFLLITFGFSINSYLLNPSDQPPSHYTTAFGEQKNIFLPDGTEVNLNVASSLKQEAFDNQDRRKVSLNGEAFFQVAKDEAYPFEITTQNVKVLVLGTAFNISSYPEDELITIAVTEGTVKVSLEMGEFNIDENLTVGQRILIDKNGNTYQVMDYDEPVYWKDQILNFQHTEFTQVINSLERWYGVDLEVKDTTLYELKLNGEFKDKTIDEVISAIGFISNKDSENKDLIEVISAKQSLLNDEN